MCVCVCVCVCERGTGGKRRSETPLKANEVSPAPWSELPQQRNKGVSHWLAPRPMWKASRGNLAFNKKILCRGPAAPGRLHDPPLSSVGQWEIRLFFSRGTAAQIPRLVLIIHFPSILPSPPIPSGIEWIPFATLCCLHPTPCPASRSTGVDWGIITHPARRLSSPSAASFTKPKRPSFTGALALLPV